MGNGQRLHPLPRDFHPTVAVAVAETLHQRQLDLPAGSAAYSRLGANSLLWTLEAQSMVMDGLPWCGHTAKSNMTYAGDPQLGSPVDMDCMRIESEHLSIDTSAIVLEPGDTRICFSSM